MPVASGEYRTLKKYSQCKIKHVNIFSGEANVPQMLPCTVIWGGIHVLSKLKLKFSTMD